MAILVLMCHKIQSEMQCHYMYCLNPVFFLFPAIPGMTVYDKGGVKIMFAFERNQAEPTQISIMLTAVNMNNETLQEFVFQAAVPKVSLRKRLLLSILISIVMRFCQSICLCFMITYHPSMMIDDEG